MGAIHHLFNKIYVVTRVALVSDAQGGFTQSYGAQANVPGYMSLGGGSGAPERIRAGGREAIVTNTFFCDYNADIKANDRLTNGGQTWNVLSINEPGNQDSHIQVLVEEVIDGHG
jgi:head-tail adaptor